LIDRRRAVLSTRFGSSDPLQGRPRDADALSVNVRDQVVDLVDELPANGAVAARVASLCDDPSSSAAGVAHEAARDEALVALLLRMANSAAYAVGGHVGDLRLAVSRLGLAVVRSIALGSPALELLAAKRDGLDEVRAQLRLHATRTGLAAWNLAPAGTDAEEALAAGIVHNIGLSALASAAPASLRAVVTAVAQGASFREAEESELGYTHAELGALLAQKWSYPLGLVLAIRDHDAPASDTRLSRVVRLADLLVRERAIGIEPAEPEALEAMEPEAARARVAPLLDSLDRLGV
jgi:HD-like signal output (HDOD) protein